jgi:imidazolonepropionase-like amidohydrolase
VLTILVAAFFAAQSPADSVLAITAARLVDVVAGTVVPNGLVIVRAGRIESVGPRGSLTIPSGATVLDLGDATLVPGFIDTHVHLMLGGRPRDNAEATLRAGFTTVQDLGALGYANLRLRDSVEAGAWVGPRIVAAGPWLGVSGGICDFSGIGVRGRDAMLARFSRSTGRQLQPASQAGRHGFAHPDTELDAATVTAVIAEGRRPP